MAAESVTKEIEGMGKARFETLVDVITLQYKESLLSKDIWRVVLLCCINPEWFKGLYFASFAFRDDVDANYRNINQDSNIFSYFAKCCMMIKKSPTKISYYWNGMNIFEKIFRQDTVYRNRDHLLSWNIIQVLNLQILSALLRKIYFKSPLSFF